MPGPDSTVEITAGGSFLSEWIMNALETSHHSCSEHSCHPAIQMI